MLCEVLKENGEMARLPELLEIAKKFNLKIISIRDLIQYRLRQGILVHQLVDANLPSKFGNFNIIIYKSNVDEKEHISLVKGNVKVKKPVLVRVHSECMTGDIFGSMRCDCREQLTTPVPSFSIICIDLVNCYLQSHLIEPNMSPVIH